MAKNYNALTTTGDVSHPDTGGGEKDNHDIFSGKIAVSQRIYRDFQSVS